ncbi:MAG: hypothetical protein ACYC0Y_13150 [Pirellulales bacterium]
MIRPAHEVLIAGPYLPPRVRMGDILYCERFGEVVVTGFSQRLGWPCTTLRGRRGLRIFTSELVRAVRNESAMAIRTWWEVGESTVTRWRKLLGVPRMTEGSRNIHRQYGFPSEKVRRRAAATARTPAGRERRRRSMKANWVRFGHLRPQRAWTTEELRLLGTDTDRAVAAKIGRTPKAIGAKRHKLGMTEPQSSPWTQKELRLVGTDTDRAVAAKIGRTAKAVTHKRDELGIPPVGGAIPYRDWTEEELRLLGTAPDKVVATKIGRTLNAVKLKRTRLGISAVARVRTARNERADK